MKIQIKITLLFTLVCTFIVVVLCCAIYFFSYNRAFQDFYTRLELRATIAAKANLDTGQANTQAFEEIRKAYLQRLPNEQEHIIRRDTLEAFMRQPDGRLLPPEFYTAVLRDGGASYRQDYRFFKAIYYQNSSGDYVIILSAVNTFARNFLNNLKTILVLATLLSIVVIVTVGLVFSRQVLAPIRRITQEVNNISATSLNKRLPHKDGKDEITELTNTFNNMLGRLEASFASQNNFVSNASHELNTPLTAIMGETEFLLSRRRDVAQYEQGLQVVLAQAGKLRNITRSLLELAQSGFRGSLAFETIKVAELLRNVEQVARSIYPECKLVTDFSLAPANLNTIQIQGSFQLLELCISNITLNACKYANGKQVTLALGATDRHVLFIIRDRGIGIPERDMPHIFDPFFRASNAQGSNGYGIGLPLAQNIIRLHQGTIHVGSREDQGTEVVVRIPRS
ncbi:Signal transduction histidine kinase [Cnuella takakiae]|uniref:histidine kinase n=1 Tax=Cnuella takakiae TaxID=1302690 RepID=A0A1M5H2Q6_9BACT|nr:sensor histidine kinase [Cnuella takakiae]OLY91139.1 hypothetical protein BUE76_03890 [Cnuella takakiae]SHG10203.1 Signal transduction histidine kinase [Cnuella takakiae]